MIKAGIIGGGGLVAREIMRILYNHPECKLTYVNSETFINKSVSSIHHALLGMYDNLIFKEFSLSEIEESCDMVFICKPHGESSSVVKDIFKLNCKIIDMGADFRLNEIKDFNFWYNGAKHHCPELLGSTIYGLPELYAMNIKNAKLIANPGCYATSIILGIAPLLKEKLIDPKSITISASSGISGAGREPKQGFNMFIDVYGNIKPYKLGTHPHIGEIEQEFKKISPDLGPITFSPQVVPLEYGIMSVIMANVNSEITENKIIESYNKFYNDCNFIRINKDRIPEIKDVAGSNFCAIGAKLDMHSNKLVIFSTLDNLIKGASGQAVQNMNIMFGLPETAGLKIDHNKRIYERKK
ncbi:N-acetyl-gamma-glutamyl-phosphate reductase [Candidatus Poribacteria bacterium]|nr:N-acetyl-gamma-glutamyl-phosphate reductase [Candidatus Poribacteria bacterium]